MTDTNQDDVLIHDVIDSIQQSIDIADRASRKKYQFALSEMEIKMTLSFDVKQDNTTAKTDKPNAVLSLFNKKNATTTATQGDSDEDKATMTLRMLFKPGGKAFLADGDDDNSGDDDSSGDSSDDSDDSTTNESDDDSE